MAAEKNGLECLNFFSRIFFIAKLVNEWERKHEGFTKLNMNMEYVKKTRSARLNNFFSCCHETLYKF